jgi:hypothetical protein
MALKFQSEGPDAIRAAMADSGWVDGEVVAAGQLRQGKAPSMAAMMTGAALVEVLRPRRSKVLPRHFVLVATPDEVLAFKASGGSGDRSEPYEIRVREGIEGRWPRSDVRITDLEEGPSSKGGTLIVGGESVPVARPNLSGDPSTDELLRLLSGA